MEKLVEMLCEFMKEEDGTTAVEYAVMLTLIIGALLLAIGALSGAIQAQMTRVTSALNGVTS